MTRVKYFDQPLPKTFRQNEIADIFKVVNRVESLQLVAPSGSGKSLLIQQLTEKSAKDKAIIAIDFNLLADKTPATALSFLESSISVIPLPSSALSGSHQGDALALDSPERNEVSARGLPYKNHTVLIMDHFENILDPSMKDFLNYLKGYYAKNRPSLSYIFVTEKPLLATNILFLSGNLSSIGWAL